MVKRPTIVDVARRAGVSIAVVSYALNGRPGVSAATRERVLRVAAEYGWRPSVAARSLRSGPQRVGLVIPADGGTLAGGDRLIQFVGGMQSLLAARQVTALIQLADGDEDAVAVCADWWAERQVFAVVLPDVLTGDLRIEQLAALEVPMVGLDGPGVPGVPMVWSDDAAAFRELGRYLLALGHRRIARVSGHAALAADQVRDEALTAAGRLRGATVQAVSVPATLEAGMTATRQLLTAPDRPTAIIYDDDAMAVAALDVARGLGLAVPADLSVVAGVDSVRCRLAVPPLTALSRPVRDYGAATGVLLLEIMDGGKPDRLQVATARLIVRGSTSSPPVPAPPLPGGQ